MYYVQKNKDNHYRRILVKNYACRSIGMNYFKCQAFPVAQKGAVVTAVALITVVAQVQSLAGELTHAMDEAKKKRRNKDFSQTNKNGGNIKRSSSGRRKMIQVRNTHMKEKNGQEHQRKNK